MQYLTPDHVVVAYFVTGLILALWVNYEDKKDYRKNPTFRGFRSFRFMLITLFWCFPVVKALILQPLGAVFIVTMSWLDTPLHWLSRSKK